VRLSYTQNGNTVKTLEDNHYYPFGLKHENYASERFERIRQENGDLYVIQPTERREWQYKYNGKEWQDELGLNFYDYGARNYDAAIGRWMNVDRFAEKFETFSPYQYAGSTPTYFIDINGDYIYINDPNDREKQYRYQNGVSQHQVNGVWQNIDSSTVLSDFVLNTVAGLHSLEISGKTGAGLINEFSGSEKSVTFQYKLNGNGYKDGVISLDDKNSSSTFVKNPNGSIEFLKSPYFITIGHELAHAQDPVKFNYMDTWYITIGGEEVTRREIYASHYENMIRAEAGLPLRTHYSAIYDRLSKSYKPEPRSRLIDKKGNSIYYGHPSSSGKQKQIQATINDAINAEGGVILKNRFNYYDKG
jgi:RHS repeat-associated protein